MDSCGGGCGGEGCAASTGTEALSSAVTESRRPGRFKLSPGRFHLTVFDLFESEYMLRLVLARTFHLAHPSHPPFRLLSKTIAPLMAAESTGTHRDPITGEVISKQYVLIQPIFSLPLTGPYCTGNSSVAKSNAKKRQEGQRMPQISHQPRPMLRMAL
jgi:hypothetical protein